MQETELAAGASWCATAGMATFADEYSYSFFKKILFELLPRSDLISMTR